MRKNETFLNLVRKSWKHYIAISSMGFLAVIVPSETNCLSFQAFRCPTIVTGVFFSPPRHKRMCGTWLWPRRMSEHTGKLSMRLLFWICYERGKSLCGYVQGFFLFWDLAHNIPNECFPFLQAAYGSLRPFSTSKQFSQNSKTKIYLSIQHS